MSVADRTECLSGQRHRNPVSHLHRGPVIRRRRKHKPRTRAQLTASLPSVLDPSPQTPELTGGSGGHGHREGGPDKLFTYRRLLLFSRSVTPDSLQPCGLYPARLLCKNFPGKNPGVACHSLLQGILLTQGSNLCLLHWQAASIPPGKRITGGPTLSAQQG